MSRAMPSALPSTAPSAQSRAMPSAQPSALRLARLRAFERHIHRLDGSIAGLIMIDGRYFWIRLGVLSVGLFATVLAFIFGRPVLGWGVLLVWAAAFTGVVILHRKVDDSLRRFRMARSIAAAQAARMELDWEQVPPLPAGTLAEPMAQQIARHPFAPDLDLVGERSLLQLVDTAFSGEGSRRLAGWLLNTHPDAEQIADRQRLVQEMTPLAGFRSRLALNSALAVRAAEQRWQSDRLLAWLDSPSQVGKLRSRLILLAALAALDLVLLLLSLLAGLPDYWAAGLVVYLVVYFMQHRAFEGLFDQAFDLGKSLEPFRAILVYLEGHPYRPGSRLEALCASFCSAGRRPSSHLRVVSQVISAASLQSNFLLWSLLNAALPWDLFFAYRLDVEKQALKGLMPTWLDAWYELEALNSLANFAYLNPGYTFPTVNPDPSGQAFAARQMGHPLIRADQRVCNDFAFEHLGEIGIVSGSNMSGKSTFLKTAGVNLVLAFAGAPVCAEALSCLPFRLFTCIHVSDSLGDGISYFYAEVRRLKALLDALEQPGEAPLFFLIDEIFRGTNNRERESGSRAYLKALASGRPGVGLISTHDLRLVELADEIPAICNYHFREEVSGDRMVFDYRLRPGPSPTTNALKIMKLEGLPVEEES